MRKTLLTPDDAVQLSGFGQSGAAALGNDYFTQEPTIHAAEALVNVIDRPAGSAGRVYGGDLDLIHVPDGKRADLGDAIATALDHLMRVGAENRMLHERATQRLCPGCYMVVMFNALVTLARRNGQPLDELAASMIGAFERLLADARFGRIEEILVLLDPEGEA